jgi:hypothetical protein
VEYLICEYSPYFIKRAGLADNDFVDCVQDSFTEVARFNSPPLTYQPIAAFASELAIFAQERAGADGQCMYVFRKTVPLQTVPASDGHSNSADWSANLTLSPRFERKRARVKSQDEELFCNGGWFATTFDRTLMQERYPTWLAALSIHARRRGTVIVETGCQTKGQEQGQLDSTVVLAKLAKSLGNSYVTAVDVDLKNLNAAKQLVYAAGAADKVSFFLCDSAEFLAQFIDPIDLLCLDSFDWSTEQSRSSQCQQHQLKELMAAYDKLSLGAVVMLGGNDFPEGGKTRLAKEFLRQRDWFCLLDLQQSVWIRSIDC